MKNIILTIFFLAFIGFTTHAEVRTEKRETNPFSKVSLRVNANLYVEQGDEHSIEVTAAKRTLDKLIVEIDDDKMVIRFSLEDRLFSDFNPGDIHIRVVTKDITFLSVQGSGDIYAEKPIETYNLDLNISGSGDIKLSNVIANHIEADIAGSGDLILSGKSEGKELKIDIAGSGDVVAYQYQTEAAYIRIAGSGNCEINVSNYLDVKIFGSGDVIYTGSPSVESSISGSGNIHQK